MYVRTLLSHQAQFVILKFTLFLFTVVIFCSDYNSLHDLKLPISLVQVPCTIHNMLTLYGLYTPYNIYVC